MSVPVWWFRYGERLPHPYELPLIEDADDVLDAAACVDSVPTHETRPRRHFTPGRCEPPRENWERRPPSFASPEEIDRALRRATQKADPAHPFEYSCDCPRCTGLKTGPPAQYWRRDRECWWDGERVRYDARPEGPPGVEFTPEQIAENMRAEVAKFMPPKLRLVK